MRSLKNTKGNLCFKRQISCLAVVFLLVLNGMGCVYSISEKSRQGVDTSLIFAQVFKSPDSFVGRKVMFGGSIVKVTNLPDKADIEIVQKDLDPLGFPLPGDATGGRFIFLKPGFVEPEVYSKKRDIVGVGKIVGSRMGKVDEHEYRYPVIELEEVHLMEKKERGPIFDPYWDPACYWSCNYRYW